MNYDEGKQFRKMLDKVDEMRQQRFNFIKNLENEMESDDITQKALSDRNFDPKVRYFVIK